MRSTTILKAAIFFFGVFSLGKVYGGASIIVLVDKSKNQLHLANLERGINIFKTFPVTLGKAIGDKMLEGDLKSPEGIYRFTQKFVPPSIKKKFGAMAFYVNYPNLIDRMQRKTGLDIMLHSTDDPARLAKPRDSDGCFVVNDQQIREIDSYIVPQQTMLLVYDNLKEEYLLPNAVDEIKEIFESWLKAWSTKDLESYIGHYSKNFKNRHMNREQYKAYKNLLNKKYDRISVKASNVKYYKHPKYSLVTYSQEYVATHRNGRIAFNVKSNKNLYLIPENGTHKIISEGN